MAHVHETDHRPRKTHRAGRAALVLIALLAVVGCSPEDGRARGGGLGADVGNTGLPIQLHGARGRNNPSFHTPEVGRVPRDAKGVPGWWAGRGE
jgi:hypothetical protein